MSLSVTVGPAACTVAENSSLEGRPAETETTTDSSSTPAIRSAAATALRIAVSASAILATTPFLMPAARVWPMPSTSIECVRRGSTSWAGAGFRRAIRHAILLVPMSSAETIALRRGDSGFIFGAMP